eukprot:CAMPEP_0119055160 /NCGR_PEP_ID=MMETSP1177-20130426/75548_1 /TAXON_ID=2985 /ORGANISM="Ochromonas sp, Strain CCMP1899" /LENGTH=238 /DNA_ID=CAMNT_0007035633 /DNA_START=2540 /DNA_END=3258 /DNA_ORIENTATION=-
MVSPTAQAEGVLCRLGDSARAEELLNQAVNLSFSTSVWPVIALAHFHQYVKGDVKKSLRLLKRCINHRQKINNKGPESYDSDNEEQSSENLDTSECVRIYNPAEDVAILIALSYCLLEHGDPILAGINIRKALQIDSNNTSAHRCSAILTLTGGIPEKGDYKGGNIDILEAYSISVMNACIDKKAISATRQSFTQCLRHAHGNPYSVRSCALQATLEGRHSDGLAMMEAAAQADLTTP